MKRLFHINREGELATSSRMGRLAHVTLVKNAR